MTLSQIAADVRRLAPEQWPASWKIVGPDDNPARLYAEVPSGAWVVLPDDIARLALGMAMVLALDWRVERHPRGGWSIETADRNVDTEAFYDSDHGDDWLLSLHAAMLWAKGETR